MSKGRTFKRCGCRDADGKRLGAKCLKLKDGNSWSRSHGTWAGVVDVGTSTERKQLTVSGKRTKAEVDEWMADVLKAVEGGGATRINPRLTLGEWLDEWFVDRTNTSGVHKYGPPIRHNTATIRGASLSSPRVVGAVPHVFVPARVSWRGLGCLRGWGAGGGFVLRGGGS